MSKIIIIGNSAAGFSCCESLVKSAIDGLEVTVITQGTYPAYHRDLLVDFLSGALNREQLFLCDKDYYAANKVNFISGSKVVKIDAVKKRVITRENNKSQFDYLVIASGRQLVMPDIPGTSKESVFAFNGLESVIEIKNRLPLASSICVAGEPEQSWQLARSPVFKDKEIKVISAPLSSPAELPHNLEWIDAFALQEIIGEGSELKAIKLSNGKAIGVDAVIFTGGYAPATDFLKDDSFKTYQGYITVNERMMTSHERILACGSVCCAELSQGQVSDKTWETASSEGKAAAATIIEELERGTICQ